MLERSLKMAEEALGSDEVHRLQMAQNDAKKEAEGQALEAKEAVEALMHEREEATIEQSKEKLRHLQQEVN